MSDTTLLDALPGDAVCGEDLSFSTEFDQIAELRRQDDPTLDQGEWVTSLKQADWPAVARLCEQLLRERTKDLRVANWLTEADALTRGYAGLARGLALAAGLCERHWELLHPQADDGDMEQRIGTLSWLLNRVTTLARQLPVLRNAQRTVSLTDMAEARALQQAIERQPDAAESLSRGKLALADVARIQKETPRPWLREQLAALHDAVAALAGLQASVDGHLGADGPTFVSAREALAGALHDLERLARETGAVEGTAASTPTTAAAASEGANTTASQAAPGVPGMLATREQALAQLRQVADFFRRTEPHSPVAYLADKAARWGELPLHEWLRQVVKDHTSLAQLEELLGVPGEPQP
jgi:type VI secretion system protein ImpA